MTIREIQELVKFMDEKDGREKPLPFESEEELSRRFLSLLRIANNSKIDLTKAMVKWLGQKKQ